MHGNDVIYVCNSAERRRRKARRETFTTPELVTTRQSILGSPAKGRPGLSDDDDGDEKAAKQLTQRKTFSCTTLSA